MKVLLVGVGGVREAIAAITNPPAEAVANGHGIADVGDATPLYDNIWVEVKGE